MLLQVRAQSKTNTRNALAKYLHTHKQILWVPTPINYVSLPMIPEVVKKAFHLYCTVLPAFLSPLPFTAKLLAINCTFFNTSSPPFTHL